MTISRMDEQPHTSASRATISAEQRPPHVLQFTIARTLFCTALIAVAAWASTVSLPVRLSMSIIGDQDIAPAILISLLLASSLGVLAGGRRGATDALRAGCALLILAAMVLTIFVALREVVVWLAS